MDDLCAHGCGLESTVQHADGRMLCLPCYLAETTDEPMAWQVTGACPTCVSSSPDSDSAVHPARAAREAS